MTTADDWRLTSGGGPVLVPGDFTATAERLDVEGDHVTTLVRISTPHADELLGAFHEEMREWSDGPAQQGEPAPPQPIERVLGHLRAAVLTADRTWRAPDMCLAGGMGTDWEIRFRFSRDRLPEELAEVVVRLSGSEDAVHVWRRRPSP